MLLAMMVLTIGFISCSSEGDDEDEVNSPKANKTIVVDGESFYAAYCSVEQTRGSGMYLIVQAVTNTEFPLSGHELIIHISPSKVADLKEGDMFGVDELSIQFFRRLNEMVANTYSWNVLEGNVTIKKINKMEMTIQIDNLYLEHKRSKVQHTISGTATLDSGTRDSKGNMLSFSDAID